MKKGRKEKRVRRLTDEELLPCMDYLHGDVPDHELKAACQYEYAKESDCMKKAAHLLKSNPTAGAGEIAFQIEVQRRDGDWGSIAPCSPSSWLIQPEWSFIWECPSFPANSWNQLSSIERADLLCALPLSGTKVHPLRLGEVIFLTRVFDEFKAMADKVKAAGEPRKKIYPILEVANTPLVHVLFSLDFSKGRTHLLQQIDGWLRKSDNQARFDKHRPKTEAGSDKEAKDRLKDLAAWRLFHELGCDGALEFSERHRKRDEQGKQRAFHDPRQGRREHGRLKKVQLNQAPLYSQQTGETAFRKAKARADQYLAELIPWEFGRYAEEAETFAKEMAERFNEALKLQKTSRNIS